MRSRILLAAVLALVAAPAAAQSEWLAADGNSVALEWRHPMFAEEIEDESLLNGAYFLSGRFGIMGFAAVAELPWGYGKFGEEDGSLGMGNIYLGAEMPLALGLVTVSAGVRLPTAPDDDEDAGTGLFVGYLSSFTDRYDAFVEATTPQAGLRFGFSATEMIGVEANLNGAYMMFSEEGADDDFVIDGGVRAFTSLMGLRLGAGVEAMNVLTADDDDDSTFAQVGFLADYSFGMVRPGLTLHLPVVGDEYKDVIDMLIGVHVEIDLPM